MKFQLNLENNCNQFDLENWYDLLDFKDVEQLRKDVEFIYNFLKPKEDRLTEANDKIKQVQ